MSRANTSGSARSIQPGSCLVYTSLSPIEDPTAAKGYKPVQMPMPEVAHASYAPNSLWRTGSRAFFKDQRARNVGDLVTVKVKVTDRAQLNNTTKRSRKNGEDMGAELSLIHI